MDTKLRETANLCIELMNSKRRVKGKLSHVVQIDVNVKLNLSNESIGSLSNDNGDVNENGKKAIGLV